MTYSGDSPFQLRLVLGTTNEKANVYPSRMPLYVTDPSFLPTKYDPVTGRRLAVDIPFRKEIPKSSLVSMDDIRNVCPDVVHMITRCVEQDLKRMGQRIVDDKYPHESESLRKLEINLTEREAKKPFFQFNRTTPATKAGKVQAVSLAGTGALTSIADMSQLQGSSNDITELYDGVWGNEIVAGTNNNCFENSAKMLKLMFPTLFNKTNPKKPTAGAQYISMYDASDLLRRSLNQCAILLRDSKDGLDLQQFSHWAEAYYQTSLLLFGEKGLTPYKLKLTIFPSLVTSGFIDSPWNHMCEGLEKSNHHAHKDFQTRTMRGGGLLHHQDPLFLECCFSYCKFLKLATRGDSTIELSDVQAQTCEAVYGVSFENLSKDASGEKIPWKTYRQICQEECKTPTIAVGKPREHNLKLAGLRFFVVGLYAGTEAAKAAKSALQDPPLKPQSKLR